MTNNKTSPFSTEKIIQKALIVNPTNKEVKEFTEDEWERNIYPRKIIQKALSLKEQEQKQKIEKLKSRLCRMNSCNPCGKCFPCLQIDEIFSEDDLK